MKTLTDILRYLLLSSLALSVFLIVPNLKRDIPVEELKRKYTNDHSKFVEIDGLEVHYRDEGAGIPLVLLHGTGASLHTWDGWTEQLKQTHRVIRMDLPAFGLTGPHREADYSIEYYVRFLSSFLDALGLQAVILGGNSLGGHIAWSFAAAKPDRVRSLVLVDPSGLAMEGSEPLVMKLARTPVINGLLHHVTPRSFIRKNLQEVYYDDEKITDKLVERYYLMALREGNREAFTVRAQTRMEMNNEELLATIHVPTLILWGAEDQWSPVALGSRFEEQITGAQLVVLPNAGHVPMEEVPNISVAVVQRYLHESAGWRPLWNGTDLCGWQKFLNTPYQLREDSSGHPLMPYGIDNDPGGVMTVAQLPEGPAISISGISWGTLHTLEEFENYHLKLQVKWGDKMHPPRENGPRDSGLLYHGFGEPGVVDRCWIASQELQIQHRDMGDYWPVGNVTVNIPSVPYERGYYQYKEGAPMRTYYFAPYDPNNRDGSLAKRRVFKGADAEKPLGEWNDIELIAFGDSSIHVVNGEVVMRLYNSRIGSTQSPLRRGKIVLQSEGAEVFYRGIYLRPINEVPEAYKL